MPFYAKSSRYAGALPVDIYEAMPHLYDPITCRDPLCSRPDVHLVRESVRARAHFAHGPGAVCRTSDASSDAMSEWHRLWQEECDDPARKEVYVPVGATHVQADVLTRFGWAVEFQHSHIRQADVRDRENGHAGRVIWVIDATDSGTVGTVTAHDGGLEWMSPPTWVRWPSCVLAVDTGEHVHLLPAGGDIAWHKGSTTVPRVVTMTRAQFAATWINGSTLPHYPTSRPQYGTRWEWLRSEEAIKAAQAREDEARRRAHLLRGTLPADARPGSCPHAEWTDDEDEYETRLLAAQYAESILEHEERVRQRQAADEARDRANAEARAQREREWAQRRAERQAADAERERAERAAADEARRQHALGRVPAEHLPALEALGGMVAEITVMDAQRAAELVERQPWGKPPPDPSEGPCALCLTPHHRYGPTSTSPLCPTCRQGVPA